MNPAVIVSATQFGIAGAATLVGGWWALTASLALVPPRRARTRRRCIDGVRLEVIVPAHNEEALIGRTVRSLQEAAERLKPRATITVVADNCEDSTATVAGVAGVRVLERRDESRRGKSFALEFALASLRNQSPPPDVVVIVDADTTVSEDFLERIAERTSNGAEVVQVHYAAAPGETPLARLRTLAFAIVHWSRPLGASRMGLPTTLKGNGMAFRWEVIRDGFPGSGITEDASATLHLASQGVVVEFEPMATVWGLMASSYAEASVQDARWEGGRLGMLPVSALTGVRLALRGRIRSAAAAFELASPPLTLAIGAATFSLLIGLVGFGSLRLAIAALGLIVGSVVLGLTAARPSRRDVMALVHTPRFVLHKALSYGRLLRGQPKTWERTIR